MRNKSCIKFFIILLLSISYLTTFAQNASDKPTQTIRGVITDAASGETIPYAVVMLDDNPEKGTVTNNDGLFIINN